MTVYCGAQAVLSRGQQGKRLSEKEREERKIIYDRARREWCDEHQRAHVREERMAKLRTLLPIAIDEIRDVVVARWPCFYGQLEASSDGEARWRRDMKAIGAVRNLDAGEWRLA